MKKTYHYLYILIGILNFTQTILSAHNTYKFPMTITIKDGQFEDISFSDEDESGNLIVQSTPLFGTENTMTALGKWLINHYGLAETHNIKNIDSLKFQIDDETIHKDRYNQPIQSLFKDNQEKNIIVHQCEENITIHFRLGEIIERESKTTIPTTDTLHNLAQKLFDDYNLKNQYGINNIHCLKFEVEGQTIHKDQYNQPIPSFFKDNQEKNIIVHQCEENITIKLNIDNKEMASIVKKISDLSTISTLSQQLIDDYDLTKEPYNIKNIHYLEFEINDQPVTEHLYDNCIESLFNEQHQEKILFVSEKYIPITCKMYSLTTRDFVKKQYLVPAKLTLQAHFQKLKPDEEKTDKKKPDEEKPDKDNFFSQHNKSWHVNTFDVRHQQKNLNPFQDFASLPIEENNILELEIVPKKIIRLSTYHHIKRKGRNNLWVVINNLFDINSRIQDIVNHQDYKNFVAQLPALYHCPKNEFESDKLILQNYGRKLENQQYLIDLDDDESTILNPNKLDLNLGRVIKNCYVADINVKFPYISIKYNNKIIDTPYYKSRKLNDIFHPSELERLGIKKSIDNFHLHYKGKAIDLTKNLSYYNIDVWENIDITDKNPSSKDEKTTTNTLDNFFSTYKKPLLIGSGILGILGSICYIIIKKKPHPHQPDKKETEENTTPQSYTVLDTESNTNLPQIM